MTIKELTDEQILNLRQWSVGSLTYFEKLPFARAVIAADRQLRHGDDAELVAKAEELTACNRRLNGAWEALGSIAEALSLDEQDSGSAPILAALAAKDAEIERLTDCLKKANSQTEELERKWYLRGDEIEVMAAEVERLTDSLNQQAREIDLLQQGCIDKDAEVERLIDAAMTQEAKP